MTTSSVDNGVLCGLPGDLDHAGDPIDFRVAKVGGQPVFPGDNPPSDLAEEVMSCRDCGKKMVLVVQVDGVPAIRVRST